MIESKFVEKAIIIIQLMNSTSCFYDVTEIQCETGTECLEFGSDEITSRNL